MIDTQKLLDNLEEQRAKYAKSRNIAEKLAAINLIIQIEVKLDNPHREFELYKDIKQWIILYLQNISEKSSGYDEINFCKLGKIIKCLTTCDQVKILKFTRRLLSKDHVDEETINKLDNLLAKTEIVSLNSEKFFFKRITKKIILYSSKDLTSLFVTCILLLICINIILLPAPYQFLEIYSIEYISYCENFYLNHFLNITAYMLDINEDDFVISTQCIIGVVLKIIGKILFYLIILNFLIKEVTKRLIYK